ncbi:sensor histidine kinase [Rhodoferax sp.]|uniref:sensor histidine kinase n=1 Tax=Rhodoferax sp. TaxID=50421 RepID=UPI00272FEE5A|nr:sensor histidine kinase [Rhodoferax sp.]MDP1529910.1 sensor histidine kinase [Rhodoferax sp.]MDP1945780.1 sensor histidine kinase [Rhodoferax sp.]MDP2442562.1 sensor histidine kinase [Rhodoferax sp.]MDZ4206333.1 sensor histidine kinase [Rhodoferax sp.]
MLSPLLVVGASFAYLLLLFAVASFGDWRASRGRSIIANPWTYALSLAVYCTAWTYFGSVGRAASGGIWFLPIYLGPTLAMILGWLVIRKMIRIAKTYRITSIADFIGSRYGKSPLLAGLVTLIAVVGIVPYIALQLKAISAGYGLLTAASLSELPVQVHWAQDSTFYLALALAGFTMVFGARHLDSAERHEGLVAAIAFESVVKLIAFLAVGLFVVYGLFNGLTDVFARAHAVPELAKLLRLEQGGNFAWTQWFALTLLSMFSVIFLPRQFQVMVVENVRESHLRRAVWVFPLYLLAINLFVLPIALGGLLYFGPGQMNADNFVLSLPLAAGQPALALFAFIGGLSAATGMVIVETIAVSTMVCNELVMPLLLRTRHFRSEAGHDLTRVLLLIRRAAILGVLVLGYVYFHLAGEAYALVSIGLISFAAVAQFAPAVLGGLYWRGATRRGALVGLLAGFVMWCYTLMLPSLAKSGWLPDAFLSQGLLGLDWLRPEQLFGLQGLDNLTHSLFWSLLVNVGAYVGLSLWRAPNGQEASQALLFVDVFERTSSARPVFWRGRATVPDLLRLCERFMGAERAQALFADYARQAGASSLTGITPDARLVQFVETQLSGAVGSASARVLVASSVDEETLTPDDVLRILDESSQLRAHSLELEEKSSSLERATRELRAANEQLKSLDRLKDDFMSSVTHELRTPLTSIRALAELMRDDPGMGEAQRSQFIAIIVSETERLSRLVNQVLDMAKIESGHAEWHNAEVDLGALVQQAVVTTSELFRERQAQVTVSLPELPLVLLADPDRLTQVLLNLLSNAAKFVPVPGGRVDVSLSGDDAGATVVVRDNGPGVSAEQQALIFEKFRQGGDAANRPQGTGLGLPISRQIVAHFGGRLWLESHPGQGAAFCFYLPFKI